MHTYRYTNTERERGRERKREREKERDRIFWTSKDHHYVLVTIKERELSNRVGLPVLSGIPTSCQF